MVIFAYLLSARDTADCCADYCKAAAAAQARVHRLSDLSSQPA
jgi:hypothetical protein